MICTQNMHVLRHGAGVAWHHEIKTVPEEISGGKSSDETMEEARRETERVRRARRRDRQRANRRRPGRPAKAGVGASWTPNVPASLPLFAMFAKAFNFVRNEFVAVMSDSDQSIFPVVVEYTY